MKRNEDDYFLDTIRAKGFAKVKSDFLSLSHITNFESFLFVGSQSWSFAQDARHASRVTDDEDGNAIMCLHGLAADSAFRKLFDLATAAESKRSGERQPWALLDLVRCRLP